MNCKDDFSQVVLLFLATSDRVEKADIILLISKNNQHSITLQIRTNLNIFIDGNSCCNPFDLVTANGLRKGGGCRTPPTATSS